MAASKGGLRPYSRLGGYNSSNTVGFWIAKSESNNFFQGDLVLMSSTGDILPSTAVDDVTAVGVFNGCEYVDSSGVLRQTNFYNDTIAQDGMRAFVTVDPFQAYKIRIANSDANTTMTRTDIGKNYDIEYNGGSTTTGRSGMCLGSTTGVTTAAQLKLLDLVNDDGTDRPTDASSTTTYTHGIVVLDPTISYWLTVTGV